MKIAMFTNTYLPHVGGVARSVQTLEDECRRLGHEVRVVAPEHPEAEASPHVLRVPAIQNFNGSDFAVRLPAPGRVREFMEDFQPDVVHSHHPFLLGDTALRQAWRMELPVVFTHHTLYEQYTHYVPLDSPTLKQMAIQLVTEYCNLCDEVIAPSLSVRELLLERGVTTPITAIPTGVDTGAFASGNRSHFREQLGLEEGTFVIGHVGRLAAEKNLRFLAKAVARQLHRDPESAFLLVGEGDEAAEMEDHFAEWDVLERVYRVGRLTGEDLTGAYAAMDVFVFSSQSETQGMVLAEAMAAGLPVVALDGPGVREIVRDGENGYLLPAQADEETFAERLHQLWLHGETRARLAVGARTTAQSYDRRRCEADVLAVYERLTQERRARPEQEPMPWDPFLHSLEIEWELMAAKMSAAATAILPSPSLEVTRD